MSHKTVDCRGMACPQPVVTTKQALEEIGEGALTIIVDNEVAKNNVCRFLDSKGLPVKVENRETDFAIATAIGNSPHVPANASEQETKPVSTASGKTVVYIASEFLGRGDDELGRSLMATYIDTLSHVAPELDTVFFVNGGVKCAVEGSPVLESVRNLENAGVKILSCGTCLNHYGLKEQLQVGEITNMYAIIEATLAAEKILTP